MSSTALRIAAVVTVLLAIVFGVIGYRMSRNLMQSAPEQAAAPSAPQTLAVVATRDLPADQPIPPDAIALVPVAIPPQRYFTNLTEVAGKAPLREVEAGVTLTPRHFEAGSGLARFIPQGHRALSVEVNEIVGVGGFLRPGDVVDLLVFLRPGPGLEQPQARVLLREVRVLAYEERRLDAPDARPPEGAGGRRSRAAVLAVPEAELARVMLGLSLGELRLALHADAGEQPAAAGTGGSEVITLTELTRLQRARGAAPPGRDAARPPAVEVFRGSERQQVRP